MVTPVRRPGEFFSPRPLTFSAIDRNSQERVPQNREWWAKIMATIYKRGGKGNRGGRYYISYFDHTGRRQSHSARTTDKATAERIAAKLEADAALRRDGVVDPELDAICEQSRRSVESHVKDYEAKMRAANRAAQHISTTVAYIRAICKDRKFEKVADIASDGVHQYAGQLKDQGRSTRTVQAYLTAIKGFTKWLAAHHKLPRDPLASVKRPNPKADRRRERRMLLPEEWQWVRATLAEGVERYEMPAEERMLLYAVAIQTGLRSSELRSLTRGRLFLDGNEPFITCKAGSTKNRQDARQFIQPALAVLLRTHIATKAPQAPVFGMPPRPDVRSDVPSRRGRRPADLVEGRQAGRQGIYAAGRERFPGREKPRGGVPRLPQSPAHLRGLAGAGRCPPQGGAIGDAALDDRADDGYLWAPLPRPGRRHGGPVTEHDGQRAHYPPGDGDRRGTGTPVAHETWGLRSRVGPEKRSACASSQGAIWCWTMRRGAMKKGRRQETAQALTLYELRACASQCEIMRSGGQGIRTLNRLPGT